MDLSFSYTILGFQSRLIDVYMDNSTPVPAKALPAPADSLGTMGARWPRQSWS
jgi:hypothetical protein